MHIFYFSEILHDKHLIMLSKTQLKNVIFKVIHFQGRVYVSSGEFSVRLVWANIIYLLVCSHVASWKALEHIQLQQGLL